MAKRIICPECEATADKVIYAGLPMYSCDSCSLLWGFWSWIPALWYNGYLFVYEGCYLKGLWEWWTNEEE